MLGAKFFPLEERAAMQAAPPAPTRLLPRPKAGAKISPRSANHLPHPRQGGFMTLSTVRHSWVGLLLLLVVGSARPAQAQLGDVGVRLHGGIVQPLGSFGDYFEFGPSFGLDLGYPLNERLDLKLDLDLDWINTTDIHPTPVTNLWRYRVGLEGDLFGDEGRSG